LNFDGRTTAIGFEKHRTALRLDRPLYLSTFSSVFQAAKIPECNHPDAQPRAKAESKRLKNEIAPEDLIHVGQETGMRPLRSWPWNLRIKAWPHNCGKLTPNLRFAETEESFRPFGD